MLPLDGVRVLDLCRVLPGPFCTMLLGDMGAEVIKVEETEDRGGVGRDMLTPPSPSPQVEERAAAYNHLARNKKSIALNLREKAAQEVFYKLAAATHVVIESYRPGVVKKLGVDYETVSRLNPGVIYCSISGYGQDSPYRDLPGHEPDYCAMAGAVGLTGDPEGRPVILGILLADVGVALHAAIGILCALRVREQTGQGQLIDISSADCLLSFSGVNLARYFRDGFVPQRGYAVPFRNVWCAGDGKYLTATNPESHLWERFCKAIGREDLIPYQRAKGKEREEAMEKIQETMLTRPRDEWVEAIRKADASVAPVYRIDEVAAEPHFRHRGMFLEPSHPTQGRVKQVGLPIKLSRTPGQFRSFAPLLGQHTDELLRSLGYSAEKIDELRKARAIK